MDAYDFAMQMEKDGEVFYRELARKIPQKGMQSILNMLADDEVKHFQILKQLKEGHKSPLLETQVLKEARNIFQEMKTSRALEEIPGGHLDLVQKAVEIEEKSRAFYSEKAGSASNLDEKEILLKLSEEEKQHQFLLEHMAQFLLRPQTWLENAEFNHLEEY